MVVRTKQMSGQQIITHLHGSIPESNLQTQCKPIKPQPRPSASRSSGAARCPRGGRPHGGRQPAGLPPRRPRAWQAERCGCRQINSTYLGTRHLCGPQPTPAHTPKRDAEPAEAPSTASIKVHRASPHSHADKLEVPPPLRP